MFILYEELSNQDYIKKMISKINLKEIRNLNFDYFKNSNKNQINTLYSKKNYENARNIYSEFEKYIYR